MENQTDVPAWTLDELRVELDRYEAELCSGPAPRNRVTACVYPVDQFLDWLDKPYRPIRAAAPPTLRPLSEATAMYEPSSKRPQTGLAGGSGRRSSYDGLRLHLSERPEPVVHLSFSEIERIIGRELPKSARAYRAWWANERYGPHVHARSWMNAEPPRRSANVDFVAETVDFVVEEAGR